MTAPNPFDHYGTVIENGTARYNESACHENMGEASWTAAKIG